MVSPKRSYTQTFPQVWISWNNVIFQLVTEFLCARISAGLIVRGAYRPAANAASPETRRKTAAESGTEG